MLPLLSTGVLSTRTDLHLLPSFHWYPDTLESQDISGPIKIGDTWHVFVDCVPEDETTEVIGPQVGLGPLQWCHFSSTDLVHWSAHPIAIRNDHDFDGAVIDTGATFQHPNGTVLAIYATVNKTSLAHTFDGDGASPSPRTMRAASPAVTGCCAGRRLAMRRAGESSTRPATGVARPAPTRASRTRTRRRPLRSPASSPPWAIATRQRRG